MKNKIIICLAIILGCNFLAASSVFAQNNASTPVDVSAAALNLEKIIAQLQNQIRELQTQITELKTQLEVIKSEIIFTKILKKGDIGKEVRQLQEFLKSYPEIYPEGLVTGYFGPLTEKAVKKFQKKNAGDILVPKGLTEPTGIVDQATLAKFNELAATPATPATPAIPAVPAQPISKTGTSTIPAIPAIPAVPSRLATTTATTATSTAAELPISTLTSIPTSTSDSTPTPTLTLTPTSTPTATSSTSSTSTSTVSTPTATSTTTTITTSHSLSIVSSIYDATHLNGPNAIAVIGNYVYVAAYDGHRFTVVDVSNAAAPIVVGSVYDSVKLANPNSITIAGTHAYVMSYTGDRLTVVDIANPRSPVIVGSVYDASRLDGPWSVSVAGKYAYVGLWSYRFTVVDVSNPANPTVVASLYNTDNLAGVKSVQVVENFAYVSTYYKDYLTTINISNPLSPFIAATVDLRVGTQYLGTNVTIGMSDAGLYVDGKYAYVVGRERLTIVDISNPLAPKVVGWTVKWDGYAVYPNLAAQFISPKSVIVSGTYAYAAAGTYFNSPRWTESGLTILDISNPISPFVVASVADKTQFESISGENLVAVSGNYAYVAARSADRLTIVDISRFPAAYISSLSPSPSSLPSPSPSPTPTATSSISTSTVSTTPTATSTIITATTTPTTIATTTPSIAAYSIASIEGNQPSYASGSVLSLTVKGIDQNNSPASRNKGYNVQALIYPASDTNFFSYLTPNPSNSFNGIYDAASGYWKVQMNVPSSFGAYNLRVVLYCSQLGSICYNAGGRGEESVKILPFTVVNSVPFITVLSPNGGEQWVLGNTYNIQWEMPSDQVYRTELYLMPQGSTPVKSTPPAPGTSDVTINAAVGGYGLCGQVLNYASSRSSQNCNISSLYPAGTYKIRAYLLPQNVSGLDSFNVISQDESDNYFSITEPVTTTATTTPSTATTTLKYIENQLASITETIAQLAERIRESIGR